MMGSSYKLRVTGGTRRGRKLESPPAQTIRPASDLVRQAVFNMIAADVEGAVFYDVFAGTGIVGIEALSRGASRAVFVERDFRQIKLIRRNLERTRFEADAAIRSGDAHFWSQHFIPETDPCIVFLGPPYPDFATDLDRMLALVQTVQAKLSEKDLLILQFPREVSPERLPEPDGWFRLRRYGKTRIGIWQRGRAHGAEPEDKADDPESDPIDDLGRDE